MTEAAPSLALAGAGGVLVGLLFFGALWWTVRRLPSARHPAALVAGSFLIRGVAAAGGIILVSGGEPLPLLSAMAGFLVARTILIRLVERPLRADGKQARAASPTGGEGRSGP